MQVGIHMKPCASVRTQHPSIMQGEYLSRGKPMDKCDMRVIPDGDVIEGMKM